MAIKYVNYDHVAASDSGDGSASTPWKTITAAAGKDRSGESGQIITYVAKAAAPYRNGGSTDPVMSLSHDSQYGVEGTPALWYFEAGTIITCSYASTGGWHRHEGYSYVWRKKLDTGLTIHSVFALSSRFKFGIRHLKNVSAVPPDGYHLHYYYSSVTGYLYICVHDLVPDIDFSIEINATGVNTHALYTAQPAKGYVDIHGGIWVGGTTYVSDLQTTYTRQIGAVCLHGSAAQSVVNTTKIGSGWVSSILSSAGRITRVDGGPDNGIVSFNNSASKPSICYNCTIVDGVYCFRLENNAGATIKNNKYVDVSRGIYNYGGAATVTASNNEIAISKEGYYVNYNAGVGEIPLLNDSRYTAGTLDATDVGTFHPVTAALLGDNSWTAAGMTADKSLEAASVGGTPFAILSATTEYLYLCFDYVLATYGNLYMDLATGGDYTGLVWEYASYNTTTHAWSWAAITMTTDNTSNLTQSGKLLWNAAATSPRSLVIDGTIYTGHWIRVHADTAVTTPATVNQIRRLFLNGEAKITNKDDYDYKMKPGSPGLNKGVAIAGITTDFNGNPIKGLPDIGAYEYQGSTRYYIELT